MYRNDNEKQTSIHKYDTYSLLEGHGRYFIVSVEPKGTILDIRYEDFVSIHIICTKQTIQPHTTPLKLPNTHTRHSYINSPSNQIVLQGRNSLKRFSKFTQLTTLPQQNKWDT